MATREDFEEIERVLMKEIVHRRQLGGFDANAPAVLILLETFYKVVVHLRERMPRDKKAKE